MPDPVSLRLNKKTVSELDKIAKLEDKDRSSLLREIIQVGIKTKKTEQTIQLYQNGKVSMWKAARLAELSLWEFMEELSARKIPIQYSEHDLEEDLKALEE